MAAEVATPSQQVPVEWNVGELRNHVRDLATKEQLFCNDKLQPTVDVITALAESLKKTGPQHDDKVARLREALKEVADVRADVRAHTDALGTTQEGLSMVDEPTDFATVLNDAAARAADSEEATAMLAEFDQAVGGGAEAIEEDDEVQVDRGADLAPNAACPITGKGVLEILEPVHDQKGFVYEKAAIVDHIRKSGAGGEVECPHHGTNHMVSLGSLREARGVIRAQRNRQRRAERQTQNPDADDGDDDVLDID